jgi:predicted dehydrogenase
MAGIGVALIGAGYWGSRLARNLAASPAGSLRWVCDIKPPRAAAVAAPLGARATTSLPEVFTDPAVDAVVVATPAQTHAAIVAACLEADRHLLVEKPFAGSAADARVLADLAQAKGLVVMCDHTYRFVPAVGVAHELLAASPLGALRSVESVRTNQDHGQPDVDVFWDLAHHDLSILRFALPEPSDLVVVSARSSDLLGVGRPHIGDLTVRFANDVVASVHVDWCAEQKVRTMIFRGDDGRLTWDDLAPGGPRLELRTPAGDRCVPVVDDREPLALVVEEFITAVAEGRAASCGPTDEIAVLSLLEAATRSAAADGAVVPVDLAAADPLGVLP